MPAGDFNWHDLPEGLRYGLLLGATGKPHLADLARRALAAPETSRLGLDILLAAWEAGPLDGTLARLLAGLDTRAGFLAPKVRAAVNAVAANWREPDDTGPMAVLAANRSYDELKDWLASNCIREPDNLFWRQHLLDLAYLLADWEIVLRSLEMPWPEGLAPLRDKSRGDVHFQRGDYQEAALWYEGARLLRPARIRLGHCLFRLGRPDEAASQWRRSLSQAPWNINLLLRYFDRLAGRDLPGRPISGPVAVCLYTSGKAAELDATLAALFSSELAGARVVVLDNGSPDATPEVLAAWRDRAGGILETITLPVNVGAPAARNWLARHDVVASSDFVAYLDDDAMVPHDWSRLFGRAVEISPDAGVWGCKVVDLDAPGRIQNVDIHLLEASGPEPAFSSLCTQDLDFGQFDYIRPCLSVTGCFHLFRTELLRESGEFDIRFSPTQYDDLDHDLRLAALGHTAVYQGNLAVRHARLSGALLNQNAQATANSTANLHKLAAKHPGDVREKMREKLSTVMLKDILSKLSA
ncbi:MAG: glycosyltransferase [Desulfovibrio sp.]|nr:glycosyltransferase [Desulfovibrio sp.]MBI4959845.1 glycosyltransferase [Desulfovibrio sp.]